MRCRTCDELVERHAMASTRLYGAASTLHRIVGVRDRARFREVLRECAAYRSECERANQELVAHRSEHQAGN